MTAPMFAIYVSNADTGDIRVFHLDPEGTLTPTQRVMVGGQVMPMALSPDRRFLYAARRSDPVEVLSFEIDPRSGELAALGEAPLPHSVAYIATDRSGRWLFSASYGSHQVAVSAIGPEGVARSAHQVLPTGPHAHAIQADPSNRFVFATSLGGGVMLQFRFDAATGALTPNDPPLLHPREAASPRHFVFDAGARFVYLLNELDAKVDVLAFDAHAGTLRTVQTVDSLPPGFAGVPWAADLHLTPDGRRLFTSERRSGTLAAFDVDAASGRLTPAGHTATEPVPRGFAITPDGRFLIAAGQASHRVAVYAIDAEDGGLRHCGTSTAGQNPNWIEVVALRP